MVRGVEKAIPALKLNPEIRLAERYFEKETFGKQNIKTIFTVQDCNMRGSFYRNFFLKDNRLHYFESNTNFFEDLPYHQEELCRFEWLFHRNS